MMMIYLCVCLKNVKKPCICACERARASGDVQLVLASGAPFLFRKCLGDSTTAPIRAKTVEVGPGVAQDVLKLLQVGSYVAERESRVGSGGGDHSTTSYKNELLTINVCRCNDGRCFELQ